MATDLTLRPSIGKRPAQTMVVVALALCFALGAVAAGAQDKERAAPSPLLPARGATDAPVTILLFSDFECPYCAGAEQVLGDVRKTMGADIQIVFKHNPLSIHPNAPLAHEAAIEAARQGRFWEMHDVLFANQQRLELPHLIGYAERLGLDVAAFRAALQDRRHRPAVERDLLEGRALGVTGTPTLFVNGRRHDGVPSLQQLTTFVKAALNGDPVAEAAGPLKPDALDLSGAPVRGTADAPITIVEFSDFQCPFCARANGTIEAVLKRYGSKVRLVFKHFPLSFHDDAPLAHRAALAAGEQGRFWEMHDLLFRNQAAMKRADLVRLAGTLGLDVGRFTSDLDQPRFDAVVERDVAEGSRVQVDGTPTFFINGERLAGAQPLEAFVKAIDRELGIGVRPAAGATIPGEVLDLAMTRGPFDAPLTIQWFADVGSPLHRDAVKLLRRVLEAHPGDVRIVFQHRPFDGRPEGRIAHEALMSAAEQGRFWELHDFLLARPDLRDVAAIARYVPRLGLDGDWFSEGIATGRARTAIERDLAKAKMQDVRGTPTFFVNGTRIDGVVTVDEIENVIAKELSKVEAGSR